MRTKILYSDPQLVLSAAEQEMASIPHDVLFNDSRYQKLKERWCAGVFGIGFSRFVAPCEVSVNEDAYRTDVDIYLRAAGIERAFQLAEVLEEGRLRGLEYKQFAEDKRQTIPYTLERGHVEGPRWLAEGTRKKKERRYAGSNRLHLLLYANFSARQLEYAKVVTALTRYSGDFASIWIITDQLLCSVFSPPDMGSVNGWAQVRSLRDYYG